MFDSDTILAWVKTHFVRKRDLASGTAIVGGLAVTGLATYTIASGVVTIGAGVGRAQIETQAAAASDDLDTINGGTVGQWLLVNAADSNRTVVVKDATGNINLAGDCTLDNQSDVLLLFYTGSAWREISRSDNAA